MAVDPLHCIGVAPYGSPAWQSASGGENSCSRAAPQWLRCARREVTEQGCCSLQCRARNGTTRKRLAARIDSAQSQVEKAAVAGRRLLEISQRSSLSWRAAAFVQNLQQLGWTDSRNVRIDYRWGGGDADRVRKYAAELLALRPDVVFASGGAVEELLRATSAVPIVFAIVPDPVGSGFGDSLSRPALRNYRILPFADTPRTEVVYADTHDKIGPLGTKSQGECAINAVAPAVANALANATGVRLPFTPDRIFDKLGVAT
jgi:hypothetical protein